MEGLEFSAKNSYNERLVFLRDETPPPSRSGGPQADKVEKRETFFETMEIQPGISDKISSDAQKGSHIRNQPLRPESALQEFFSELDLGEVIPTLRLIHIRVLSGRAATTEKVSLDITRNLFDRLLIQSRANPWVRWLLSNKFDGLHFMKAEKTSADTYFFGFYHCVLIWTFSPATAFTKLFLIDRAFAEHETLCGLIDSYTPHLFTPNVPLLAGVMNAMLRHDENLDELVDRVINVEKGTGFAWGSSQTPTFRFDVDMLATWSRKSTYVQINVINILRHHDNCIQALKVAKDLHFECPPHGPAAFTAGYDKSMTEILDAIGVMEMRAGTFASYATYIKSRAEAQISVIFALLGHEDSISSIKLAEASMDIAAAAKRDSSAMKTVAVVTMAFLPATFLAAFFAMPVFEWEQKTDIRLDGFQLYWAVAAPATAVVFVVWALSTQRDWIMQVILKRPQVPDELGKKHA